jgi:rod shape determining protein RodA
MEKRSLTKRLRFLWAGLDPKLSFILLALVIVGNITFISASSGTVISWVEQSRNLLMAIVIMWFTSRIPVKWLEKASLWIYLIGLSLLIAVAVVGLIKKGARRWLNIGVVIQPSEIMKIAMPMMLSWYFYKREENTRLWDFGLAFIFLLLPTILIARQPDLGTSILVFAAGFYVILLAGFPWKFILPFVGIGLVSIILIVIFGDSICAKGVNWPFLQNYQQHRVCTLLDPTTDPLGKGFHTIQSMIAIGSGGFLGKGWMKGTQTHLDFIPEKHTDFIFAVFSEEFGLVGNFVLLVLFLLLIQRGLSIAASASNLYTRLLGGSVTLIFFTYAFVNMAMVSGLLPVVGVPLPFISYGGTALATLGLGAGILMSIHRHRRLVQT